MQKKQINKNSLKWHENVSLRLLTITKHEKTLLGIAFQNPEHASVTAHMYARKCLEVSGTKWR